MIYSNHYVISRVLSKKLAFHFSFDRRLLRHSGFLRMGLLPMAAAFEFEKLRVSHEKQSATLLGHSSLQLSHLLGASAKLFSALHERLEIHTDVK